MDRRPLGWRHGTGGRSTVGSTMAAPAPREAFRGGVAASAQSRPAASGVRRAPLGATVDAKSRDGPRWRLARVADGGGGCAAARAGRAPDAAPCRSGTPEAPETGGRGGGGCRRAGTFRRAVSRACASASASDLQAVHQRLDGRRSNETTDAQPYDQPAKHGQQRQRRQRQWQFDHPEEGGQEEPRNHD